MWRRHEAALYLKIDELVHGLKGVHDEIMGAETKTESEIEAMRLIDEDMALHATPREHISF